VVVALEFCAHEDVVFDDAPLVMVLTQVRFPPILSLMAAAGVAGFQAGIRDEYPVMLPPTRQASVQIGPEAMGAQASAPVWKFADDSKQWTVGIATDFVSLETPKYSEIDEFILRFQRILEVARRTLRPAESLRIGFRKVNMFQVDGPDTMPLTKMIRAELLGVLSVAQFPAPLAGSFTETRFQDNENALVVRHGLADTEGKPVTKFVLDMDYFTERPYQVGGDESMTDLLRYFSDGMTSFFHWALVDSYKQELHPRARTEAK
jgi:uncharacterized protein (TIGR04255 family)